MMGFWGEKPLGWDVGWFDGRVGDWNMGGEAVVGGV
jgi:hypothetical protein